MQRTGNYFAALGAALGRGWSDFWFTPASAASLGAIRVLLGAVSLYAIAAYGPDLQAWMAPDGMLPQEMIRELYPAQWSVLNYVPSGQLVYAHVATLALLTLLTIGVGGRLVVILSTAMVLSYFNRIPVVTGEFEPVVAFLLVYLCIGRAGDAFSVEAAWRRKRGDLRQPEPTAGNAISLRLMQVHMALVCLMMGLAQVAAAEAVWWSGEGVWLAAARPDMAFLDFRWLAENHKIAAAWSHAIVFYLLTFPVFVWMPLARPLVLAAGAIVWLSLAVATGWLLFCAAMSIGTLAFWPSPRLDTSHTREPATAAS